MSAQTRNASVLIMRFLDKHSARDKQLRALEREMDRLRHAQNHAPIVPLEHPYQRGWVKFYVLDDEVAKLEDTSMFRAMLPHINKLVYAHDRSFVSRRGNHPIVLRPRVIPTREWIKLAWPLRYHRFFRYGSWRCDDRPWMPIRWREHIHGFKLTATWWLREEVRPNLITHQRVELPEVRSRLAEIETYMEITEGWNRLHWLRGRRQSWWRRIDRG